MTVHLTPREFEILRLLASGYTSVQVSIALGISQQTIKNHLTVVYRRYRVHNLVWLLHEIGWTTIPETCP